MLPKLKQDRTLDFVRFLEREPFVAEIMGRLREHHEETYYHALRVACLAVDVALENGLTEDDVWFIAYGALLHDIGKIDIPQGILNKPGQLSPEERAVIRGHPRHGFMRLSDPFYADIRKVVVAHHEYSAVDSYPRRGRDRREIQRPDSVDRRVYDQRVELATQIVAAVDMLDALLNVRGYKRPFAPQEVRDTLPFQYNGPRQYVAQAMDRM